MPEDIHYVTDQSEQYPPLLREIAQPPTSIYIRGNIDLLHTENLLAVVGSRKASAYGKQAVDKLLTPAVKAGVSLVSGLAFGIDSLAHRLCVDHDQPTIAVLGSGVDDQSIYPKSHISLAKHILATGGALISEYPIGTPAYNYHFPARNRIIAGLTRATLIIQATVKSGSLITARLALESNRDVLTVPGAITNKLSEGTNQLLKQGAVPITHSDDVLAALNMSLAEETTSHDPDLSAEQRTIFDLLSDEPQHVDDITTATKLPAANVSATLVELEMNDVVTNLGGMKYAKK